MENCEKKVCKKCGEAKTLDCYSIAKYDLNGNVKLQAWCKVCKNLDSKERISQYSEEKKEQIKQERRENHKKNRESRIIANKQNKQTITKNGLTRSQEYMLKHNFNMSGEEYIKMFNSQQGLCEICKKAEVVSDVRLNKIRNLAVDHNHDTNQVRGLLCIKCNSAIGHLNDDIDLIYISLLYLLKYSDINLIEFLENKLKELKKEDNSGSL